jgi:hypothetical protein
MAPKFILAVHDMWDPRVILFPVAIHELGHQQLVDGERSCRRGRELPETRKERRREVRVAGGRAQRAGAKRRAASHRSPGSGAAA